jgi:hypothetical protein
MLGGDRTMPSPSTGLVGPADADAVLIVRPGCDGFLAGTAGSLDGLLPVFIDADLLVPASLSMSVENRTVRGEVISWWEEGEIGEIGEMTSAPVEEDMLGCVVPGEGLSSFGTACIAWCGAPLLRDSSSKSPSSSYCDERRRRTPPAGFSLGIFFMGGFRVKGDL